MADGNQASTSTGATEPKTAEGADGTGFRPVTGGEEMQSGGRLLVEAYAAIWLILLGLVVVMWRRTRALEARIAVLDIAVKKAEKSAAAAKAAKPAASPAASPVGATAQKKKATEAADEAAADSADDD